MQFPHIYAWLCSLLRRGLLQSPFDCTLGKKRAGAGKREKLKRAGNAFPSSRRSPRSCFLSPALPLHSFFLSLVFTNRSLCGGESIIKHKCEGIAPITAKIQITYILALKHEWTLYMSIICVKIISLRIYRLKKNNDKKAYSDVLLLWWYKSDCVTAWRILLLSVVGFYLLLNME